MSALVGEGSGIEQLLPGVIKAFDAWNKRSACLIFHIFVWLYLSHVFNTMAKEKKMF